VPEEPLRIMAIGAHPPDVISRAGGTLARHARRGDVAIAVSLTDGVRHLNKALAAHRRIDDEAIANVARTKHAEMEEACQILGVRHLRYLGLRESPLATDMAALRAVSDVIREFRPDVLLTHHPEETYLSGHIDHGAAGDLVLRAYMLAMELGFESQYLPWSVNRVLLFDAAGSPMEGPGIAHMGRPTVWVDISDVIDGKRGAILAMGKTMGYTPASVEASITRTQGREQLAGVDYAEGFCELHTPVVDYLERRTKGRWVGVVESSAWEGLDLWPLLKT
jgi:N-acetylglucosamine malate deacetylase 1